MSCLNRILIEIGSRVGLGPGAREVESRNARLRDIGLRDVRSEDVRPGAVRLRGAEPEVECLIAGFLWQTRDIIMVEAK